MIVEGALVDASGTRSGFVRIERGRVVERGSLGTASARKGERRVRGIVLPAAVNGHTHLGDAAFGREPPAGPVSRLVAPPNGVKFRLLRDTPPEPKRAAIRAALERMAAEGTGAVVDFREEGLPGVRLLREAARGVPVEVFALGRPLRRPLDRDELTELLEVADGVGLSSAREEDHATRATIATACRRARKRYALHASEVVRERPEDYLEPRPDLLVHMFRATDADLRTAAEAKVPVVLCPRSNALFGHTPDLSRLERAGLTFFLGTDNAMFSAPSMLRELEFAYVSQRMRHHPVRPAALIRAAFVSPWEWLGRPECARLEPGNPVAPLVLRLPTDDPEYQVVARAAEHLMASTGSPPLGPRREVRR